jgi:hypothetical protein
MAFLLIRGVRTPGAKQRMVLRVVVSRPCARKKAQERGTEPFHSLQAGETGGGLAMENPTYKVSRWCTEFLGTPIMEPV